MPNASPSGIASIANEPMAFSMVARADGTSEDYRTATHRMRRLTLTHGVLRLLSTPLFDRSFETG